MNRSQELGAQGAGARRVGTWRGLAALATTVALGAGAAGLVAGPAQAAARVTVTTASGTASAGTPLAADAPTSVTVSGTGFQSVQGGFGGIYVFFGWVDDPTGGTWAPSQGGVTGEDLRYVPDSESKDNQGYQRFVTFPGSETAYAANGGEVAADGSWSTTMTVPGSTFQAVDRTGATSPVDCLTVTCGIITIGAHGVKNATNETFTPLTFAGAPASAAGSGSGSASATGAAAGAGAAGRATGAGTSTAGTTSTSADDAALDAGAGSSAATLGVDRSTIVAGRVLGFTGQGFTPGEQVVASLGSGLAAVGPLTAGAHGEVAGVLQLPSDLRVGTHTVTLTGAASGQAPTVELQVVADAVAAAAAANAAEQQAVGSSPALVATGAAGLVLVGLIVSSFVTARRRRAGTRGRPDSPTAPGPAHVASAAGAAS